MFNDKAEVPLCVARVNTHSLLAATPLGTAALRGMGIFYFFAYFFARSAQNIKEQKNKKYKIPKRV